MERIDIMDACIAFFFALLSSVLLYGLGYRIDISTNKQSGISKKMRLFFFFENKNKRERFSLLAIIAESLSFVLFLFSVVVFILYFIIHTETFSFWFFVMMFSVIALVIVVGIADMIYEFIKEIKKDWERKDE